ncbi:MULTISPECIES: hypothetical protein [Pseudomonas]|uniref:Lipoprotein n=1 Tax=Pseudomonas frederiksbergensis TaxID=104087 RepID=A0A6L5BXP3_9PSED|nr:hypothetical protein [Pseudomonas frederiksbergensis]KAF2391964.1 hypothetical protein FX983_06449 [Pseudomonas frederiksbergensis]
MKVLPIVVSALVLAGCSTDPIPSRLATEAPPSQRIEFQHKPQGEYAILQVVRDSGHTGSLCSMGIYINGQKAALLDPGQKVSFYLPPGALIIGAGYSGSGMCGMGAARIERDASVVRNSTRTYRVSTSGDGVIDVSPTLQ